MDVYLEIGKKRTFAAAVDWPGWSRSGRDEESALQALVDYGARYASVVGRGAGFAAPKDTGELTITERLTGDAATDFGVPGAIPVADRAPLTDDELGRLEKTFHSCWKAFERASKGADGKELSKGPRGGGRDLAGIDEHVRGAEDSYAAQVGLRGDLLEAWVRGCAATYRIAGPVAASAGRLATASDGQPGMCWTMPGRSRTARPPRVSAAAVGPAASVS
jgi:hypothetical protein